MKRIILLSALSIISLNLVAQRAKEQSWKDLSLLSGQNRISVVVDFSQADILNMDAEDFIAQEPEWENGLAEMKTKFIQAFNEKSTVRAVMGKETDYTLTITPLTVTEKGSHIKGILTITDKEGNEVFQHRFDNEAGMFGSAVNLMGDAFEDLGEELGKTFKKSVK